MGFLENLVGGSGNSVRFEEVGASVKGTVVDMAMVDSTDFDGNPTVVPVLTIKRTDTEEGEEADIWMSKSALQKAVKTAVKASGAADIEKGGLIVIQRIEDGEARKGYSPPHLFEAAYSAPAMTTAAAGGRSAADLLGG